MLSSRKYSKREFYDTYGLNSSNIYYSKIKQEHRMMQTQLNLNLTQIERDTRAAQLRARRKQGTSLEKRQITKEVYSQEYINDVVMYNKHFAEIIKSERLQKRSILQQMVSIRRQHRDGQFQVKSSSKQENTIKIEESGNYNVGRRLKRHNNSPAAGDQKLKNTNSQINDPIKVIDYQISRGSTKNLQSKTDGSDLVINCVDNEDLFNCTDEIFGSEQGSTANRYTANSMKKSEQPIENGFTQFIEYQQNMHLAYFKYIKQKKEEEQQQKQYEIEDKKEAFLLINQVLQEMDDPAATDNQNMVDGEIIQQQQAVQQDV